MVRRIIQKIFPVLSEYDFYTTTINFFMTTVSGELLPPKYSDWRTYVKLTDHIYIYSNYPVASVKDLQEIIDFMYRQFLRTRIRADFECIFSFWWDTYGTKLMPGVKLNAPKDTLYTKLLKWIYRYDLSS